METHDERQDLGRQGSEAEVSRLSAELQVSRENERAAVARLRAALLASEPALDESVVRGETLEEVESTFSAAREVLAGLRERAAAESAARVPAGAPGRLTTRPRTAFEKIRDGLGKG